MVGKQIKKVNLANKLFGSGEPLPKNLTFKLAEGYELPSALNLTQEGILSGTPYVPFDENVVVKISADYADPVEFTIDFNIARPVIEINFESPYEITGVAGTALNQISFLTGNVIVTNGATPNFEITNGALPSGLSFNAGILNGTPVEPADGTTATVTITSEYAIPSSFNLLFNITRPTITIDTANLPSIIGGLINQPMNPPSCDFTQYITTSNGAIPVFSYIGTVPAGISFGSDGILSGTPTAVSNDTIEVQISIDYAEPVTFNLTFDIDSEIAINNVPSIMSGFVGKNLSGGDNSDYNIDMNQYVTNPDNIELEYSASGLPYGLSITRGGLLCGKYIEANYALNSNDEYVNNGRSASAVFKIHSEAADDKEFTIPFFVIKKPSIVQLKEGASPAPSGMSGFVGSPVEPIRYLDHNGVIEGSESLMTYGLFNGFELPSGIVLTPDGIVSGIPLVSSDNGVVFSVKHPYADDMNYNSLTFDIRYPEITLNPVSAIITGTVGRNITALDVNGYATINNGGNITWTAPSLPEGLTFTDNVLSGIPLVSSHETIYLSASSPYADVEEFEVKFNINKPVIKLLSSSIAVSGTVGEELDNINLNDYIDEITDGSEAVFSAAGLPNGLSVSEIREVKWNS